jgi:hypothetical protein
MSSALKRQALARKRNETPAREGFAMALREALKEREFLVLIFCILVAFGLRFYRFDHKSLWLDEIYTLGDSTEDLRGQIKFYRDNPTYLQAPLFFTLTHQLHPFTKPERDLRVIPLAFGTLGILMIYLLARQFSSSIALPCSLSLAFMTYHISLSQDGRSYTFLMVIGMAGLLSFMKHLKTTKKGYLLLAAFLYSVLFHTSYSSILFILFSQILWFYRPAEESQNPGPSSFFILNGLILIFCFPWILFVAAHYKSQSLSMLLKMESTTSFWSILYGVFNDWTPHLPLMIVSFILLILFPILSRFHKNALLLLAVFVSPMLGVYLFCKAIDFSHFVTSRYFINFLPLFLITLFLSVEALEERFEIYLKALRLKFLFVILLVASSLVILPVYYRSEKQDFKGLANYLTAHIQEGDKIIVSPKLYIHGLLYYFGIDPSQNREYLLSERRISKDETECSISLFYKGKRFTISHSKTYWNRYIAERDRVWLVVDKETAQRIMKVYPVSQKAYFDGSVLCLVRFPTDVSMYLLLFNPLTP